MFNHCQPIFIDNLYGLLTINTTDSSRCFQPRQWYFFYDYGYILLIRLINTAHLISNAFVLKIFSTKNEQKTLIFDSSNTTLIDNELQFDMKTEKSGVWLELISMGKENLPPTSFVIDYAFRGKRKQDKLLLHPNILASVQSRYGRQILQQNTSFDASQPAFIALITIIAVLVVAIIIAISILCYRYCSHRKHSKHRRVPLDQAHLAESNTPSSSSSYSIRSTQQTYPRRPTDPTQQVSSLGQSTHTLPSMIPSRRLQQSMMDAYLNDFHTLQPTTIDPKQLHPYLFIDLHSTSSETVPDANAKKYSNENSTTSGYDTSTGGEERNRPNSFRYRRRRRSYHRQQRRRSNLAFKRTHTGRFLMRERSLPSTLNKLPQLRQRSNRLFNFPADQSSSNTSNPNQDFLSTNLSLTTDNYDDTHAYHISESRLMDTIEEERVVPIPQPGFFEMVSIHRGDESDLAQYEDLSTSHFRGNGIAYINESIIV